MRVTPKSLYEQTEAVIRHFASLAFPGRPDPEEERAKPAHVEVLSTPAP